MHAALCLILKRIVSGKLDALRIARERFRATRVFAEAVEIVERHYEVPELYQELAITQFDDRMEQALHALRQRVADELTLIPEAAGKSAAQWQAELGRFRRPRADRLFDSVKFLRLTKGRLWFYGNAPTHFDNAWVIDNEFGIQRRLAINEPLSAFFEARPTAPCRHIVERVPELCPDVLTAEEAAALQECHRLLLRADEGGDKEAIARELSRLFGGVLSALNKLFERASREETMDDGPWTMDPTRAEASP